MLTLLFLLVTSTGMSSSNSPTLQSSTTPKISTETIQAAAKRANARLGMNVKLVFQPSGDGVFVEQLPPKGGQLARTGVATVGGTQFTVAIQLYPQAIYDRFPGSERNERFLEDMVYLILCHEYEHMPPSEGGRGVPGHPSDPGGSQTTDNRCETIRHYIRDADRACADVAAAQSDPNLTTEERCKRVKGYCRFHKMIQELANTPLNLQTAPNCQPPIPASSVHIVHDCNCDAGDCPNPQHHF